MVPVESPMPPSGGPTPCDVVLLMPECDVTTCGADVGPPFMVIVLITVRRGSAVKGSVIRNSIVPPKPLNPRLITMSLSTSLSPTALLRRGRHSWLSGLRRSALDRGSGAVNRTSRRRLRGSRQSWVPTGLGSTRSRHCWRPANCYSRHRISTDVPRATASYDRGSGGNRCRLFRYRRRRSSSLSLLSLSRVLTSRAPGSLAGSCDPLRRSRRSSH